MYWYLLCFSLAPCLPFNYGLSRLENGDRSVIKKFAAFYYVERDLAGYNKTTSLRSHQFHLNLRQTDSNLLCPVTTLPSSIYKWRNWVTSSLWIICPARGLMGAPITKLRKVLFLSPSLMYKNPDVIFEIYHFAVKEWSCFFFLFLDPIQNWLKQWLKV